MCTKSTYKDYNKRSFIQLFPFSIQLTSSAQSLLSWVDWAGLNYLLQSIFCFLFFFIRLFEMMSFHWISLYHNFLSYIFTYRVFFLMTIAYSTQRKKERNFERRTKTIVPDLSSHFSPVTKKYNRIPLVRMKTNTKIRAAMLSIMILSANTDSGLKQVFEEATGDFFPRK